MSVYNGAPFVGETVRSVLEQTFRDFEFLIIDNASTDASRDIVASFEDPRIRLVLNDVNVGPPCALNQILRLARGKYLARIDADDIAMPDRIAQQVKFLEEHPDYAALGTERQQIDPTGQPLYTPTLPIDQADILWRVLFTSPLGHSSVTMRRDAVISVGGYDGSLRHAADYQLWSEMISQGFKIGNLPQQLMRVRIHPGADTRAADKDLLLREVAQVSHRNLQRLLGMNPTLDETAGMIRLLTQYERPSRQEAREGLSLIHTMGHASGDGAGPFYGRTLLSLALSADSLSPTQRLSLFLKGARLIAFAKGPQRWQEFLKTWVFSGRFISRLYSGRGRLIER